MRLTPPGATSRMWQKPSLPGYSSSVMKAPKFCTSRTVPTTSSPSSGKGFSFAIGRARVVRDISVGEKELEQGRRAAPALAHRRVPAGHAAVAGEDELPELHGARAEPARRRQQVVAPHAAEALAVLRQLAPARLHVAVPGHEGRVVVLAEAVQVLGEEQALGGGADLRSEEHTSE